MAILYGQITTNKPVTAISSTGNSRIVEYRLMIDIEKNRPIILDRRIHANFRAKSKRWRGTVVEIHLRGSYPQAMPKVLEYLKQTAIVNPYANIIFVDPRGRLYKFDRTVNKMPPPPKEINPHPHGVDVETIQRIIRSTTEKDMLRFMQRHFHRVGEKTARDFLKKAGIPENKDPKTLRPEEVVYLVEKMREYDGFLPPEADCLSPLGEDLLRAGVLKELEPEFVAVHQRKPSAYSGYPFIVEVPAKDDVLLYRFANKIPLVYDESGDVCWRIVRSINWRRYNVSPSMPFAVLIHVCSTKIPYKTLGKEILADQPEVSRRLTVFSRYLPKIAQFSAELAGREAPPDINKLYCRRQVFKDFVTSNDYVDSEMFDSRLYNVVFVHVRNKHEENAAVVRVLGLVGSKWDVLISGSVLTSGSEMYETLRGKYEAVKIQAKSLKPDKESLLDAYIDGISG